MVKLSDEQKRLILDRDIIIKCRSNLYSNSITDVLKDRSLEYDLKTFKELNKSLIRINKQLGI